MRFSSQVLTATQRITNGFVQVLATLSTNSLCALPTEHSAGRSPDGFLAGDEPKFDIKQPQPVLDLRFLRATAKFLCVAFATLCEIGIRRDRTFSPYQRKTKRTNGYPLAIGKQSQEHPKRFVRPEGDETSRTIESSPLPNMRSLAVMTNDTKVYEIIAAKILLDVCSSPGDVSMKTSVYVRMLAVASVALAPFAAFGQDVDPTQACVDAFVAKNFPGQSLTINVSKNGLRMPVELSGNAVKVRLSAASTESGEVLVSATCIARRGVVKMLQDQSNVVLANR